MTVSGLRTSVPGSVRVWSAVADTPQSTQTVSCGSRQRLKQRPRTRVVFFFSRQGEESERSGITAWLVVKRDKGSGVTLLRAVRESVTSQRPCHQKR